MGRSWPFVMPWVRALGVTSLILASGCGGSDEGDGTGGSGGGPACEPPGFDTGADCIQVGMAADQCAPGFEHDGAHGCVPIVPTDLCPYGTMAAVGEDSCRPVAPCGEGKWGDIPTTAQTQHVDGSYAGGDSDGTAARPWVSITEGVAAVPSSGLVAIAAGSYHEDVVVNPKAVTLWGVCPEQVEVVGSSAGDAAIVIHEGSSGSVVRNLALTGATDGLVVTGSVDVTAHQLWIHDTGHWGMAMISAFGSASVVVTDSLIEQSHQLGVLVDGSQVSLERSVIRATQPALGSNGEGFGLAVQVGCTAQGCDNALRSAVTLSGSVVEGNHSMGVHVAGSDMVIEGSVIRWTLPEPSSQTTGRGVSVQPTCDSMGICDPLSRGGLTLRGSFVHQNHDVGVFVGGSDAVVDRTVISGTQPRAADLVTGRGLSAIIACTDEAGCDPTIRSTATVQSSVVEHNHDAGIFVAGADLTVQGTLVRNTVTRPDGLFGDGIAALSDVSPSTAFVSETLVDQSARAGVASFGSALGLARTTIRCAAFALEGQNAALQDYVFDDLGGNRCGCPDPTDSCHVVSNGLEPPEAMP